MGCIGKKLRRNCSDLMEHFTPFPRSFWDLSHKAASVASMSDLKATKAVLLTSGLIDTRDSAAGHFSNKLCSSSSAIASGRSWRMTVFRLLFKMGLICILSLSTMTCSERSAASKRVAMSTICPISSNCWWPARIGIGICICESMFIWMKQSSCRLSRDSRNSNFSRTFSMDSSRSSVVSAIGLTGRSSLPRLSALLAGGERKSSIQQVFG
mmetsp:Transcript_69986/g.167140  ORF Transcript_69986/g.167140 Transcript_69986/m.167140 type:complete len:211 (-) Transcript_69986:13-645(-)